MRGMLRQSILFVACFLVITIVRVVIASEHVVIVATLSFAVSIVLGIAFALLLRTLCWVILSLRSARSGEATSFEDRYLLFSNLMRSKQF